jgi:hypothetical protein
MSQQTEQQSKLAITPPSVERVGQELISAKIS